MNVGVDGLDPSSIQLIGTAVTPAVMVSGCGILATGLDNQISRITARMRDMVREWRTLPEGHARRSLLREEVAIMDRRHAILARAIGFTYAALLSFVVTSLLYLLRRSVAVPEGLPVMSFSLGVGLLGSTAVLALASLRLSRRAITLEGAELFRDGRPGDPPAP
ncbi:DUF2721 domain-containing protein [Corallococcus exiguus]|uniref:DUF2721 domain-containing protein n=1 Tax=Corallococcus exiguus TaxID=83462 RepID=A0A7X4Y4Y6_9BACT|nr:MULTISPECIES: DUF2721 domain-containing protein [Corallococcus]NBC38736.1 DUF2721 domain-containing protein [Corallococcus exiguus]NNC18338.1 DUF2721 domain-containing protein [Corallococcus exiguus]NPC72890.1 DUF2721 domain-containing protein [Corallococcus exiguus]NPD24805.1 DUF2721 domain-containing protein [Corallococcus exiguus]NRD46536.1 DUF2721 domain-containing protein [Corallococcus exiguus]